MSKWSAFRHELWVQIGWTLTAGGIVKVVLYLLTTLGLLGSILAAVAGASPRFVIIPGLVVVAYFAFAIGGAWESVRGPEMEVVEPLAIDPFDIAAGPVRVFCMRLVARSRRVKPIVKIVHLEILARRGPFKAVPVGILIPDLVDTLLRGNDPPSALDGWLFEVSHDLVVWRSLAALLANPFVAGFLLRVVKRRRPPLRSRCVSFGPRLACVGFPNGAVGFRFDSLPPRREIVASD